MESKEQIGDLLHYRDHEGYNDNPFMPKLVRHLSKNSTQKIVNSRMVSKADPEADKLTGFMIDHEAGDMLVSELKVVDSEKFTKVYHEAIKDTHDLTDKAMRILMWYIAPKLGKDQIQLIFNLEECMEVIGCSRPTVYSGLAELLNARIIAKSKLNWLIYIDPAIIFNGDRLAVTKVYLKEGSSKAKIAHNLDEMYNSELKVLGNESEE